MATLVDGAAAMTATLLVFCEEGRFKACFHDRDEGRTFFRSSESFQELLETLERALADGVAEWRPDRKRTTR